jgi:tRNA G37 N-methylase TrmD
MWSAKIFTLYPEFFPGILDIGLYKRARENKSGHSMLLTSGTML